MKLNKLLFLPLMGLFTACSLKSTPKDEIKEFIPGVYIAPIQTEYSKGDDTLRIRVYDEKVNTYVIVKRTGYNRIKEGSRQPKEYAYQKWVAVYDESTHVLRELKNGKLFIFSPGNHSVLLGTTEYKKAN